MYLAGNIIMFIASCLMILSGLPKNKKTCAVLQTVQIFGMAAGNLCLGSFPGFFVNCCSGIRNILESNNKLTTLWKILVIVVSSIISIMFNNIGFIVICPLISLVIFTLFMDTKNVVVFKLLVITTSILWGIHDATIASYVALAFDALSIVTNIIGIFLVKKGKSKK